MGKIVAFSGSLSSNSINRKLVELVGSRITDHEVQHLNLANYPLPLYSSQTENELGLPENANELYSLFGEADGFIVSVPEYNSSLPAGFKNMVDWLSRNPEKVFRGKPVLLMSTSPGGRGGRGVLDHLESTMPYWGAKLDGIFSLPKFGEHYSEQGLADEYDDDLNDKINILLKSINT